MNKLNKKGFTLIEMLVVIAIIAVLVSIVIPTVTSATDKAAAAANAANLRSVKAEMVTKMLTGTSQADVINAYYDANATDKNQTLTGVKFKEHKDVNSNDGFVATYDSNKKDIVVTFDGLKIDEWAAKAS